MSFNQCGAQDRVRVATLRFAEAFATAFKLRTSGSQSVPGLGVNTESGLVVPGLTGTELVPGGGPGVGGLADFGTRVKATFVNIPPGVKIFAGARDLAATPRLAFSASESGPFSPVAATQTIDGQPAVELPVVNGSAVAVYEVTNAETIFMESADVPVWISYAANVPPVTGVPVQVSGSFGPTSSGSAWTTASATLPVPRFVGVPPAIDLFGIAGCGNPAVTFDSLLAKINESLQHGGIDNGGIAQALSSHIRTAAAAAGRGQKNAAANSLNAFQNLVNAQTGKHIERSTAALLLEQAHTLIRQLMA